MKKNVSGQSIGVEAITAADGTAFTGTITVYVTGDNGTQAIGSVGSGICTHEGNGYHSYAPAQAETNYDHIAFTFIGTGAIPVTNQLFTTFPQSVDNDTAITANGVAIGALNNVSTADVNAACDTALVDFAGPTLVEMTAAFTQIKGATWATTDTLEAIRNRGDAAWGTATGFNTVVPDNAGIAANGVAIGALNNVSTADVNAACDTALVDFAGPTLVEMTAAFTQIKGATWSVTDTLEAIRNRGDAAWGTASGFNTVVPDNAGISANGAAIAALNDFDPTAQMTESYAANGVAPTFIQAQFAMHQMIMQFGIVGTNYTVRKLDDTTPAFVVTLNDATNPTGAKRI